MNSIVPRIITNAAKKVLYPKENVPRSRRSKPFIQILLRKWGQPTAMVLIGFQLIGILSGCTTAVTKYRTEQVPETVTKYRSELQTVNKDVEVPYTEEVKVPQYLQKSPPRINPSSRTMKIALLPFTTQSGNAADGKIVSDQIEGVLRGNKDGAYRFSLIGQEQILNATGKSDATQLRPSDSPVMREVLGLEALVTGHVQRIVDQMADFRIEVFDLATQKAKLRQAFSGPLNISLQKVEDIFFGRRVIAGYRTEIVNKTRTERQMVTERVDVPYQATEYTEKKIAYEEKEFDLLTTLLGVGLLLLVMPKSSDD